MAYRFERKLFYEECDAFYSTYPADVSSIEIGLNERYRESPDASAYVQKKWLYEAIARHCDVKVFRHSPIYSEVITGRERCSVSSGFPPIKGLPSWVLRNHYPVASFAEWRKPYAESDLILADMMVDHSHHYANVENVLKYGYEGLKRRALAQKPRGEAEAEFLEAVKAACDAAFTLGEKFRDEAERMLQDEADPLVLETLEKIRDTAAQVPRYPAKTFYEALNAVWFAREICTSFEGSGFAVMGHYDRILYPYYKADLDAGRITPEEAQALMDNLLSITDARWDLTVDSSTNCSLVIGGCDAGGNLIFNDVTRMILRSYLDNDLINPKLQARMSEGHPMEYKGLVAQIAASGKNVLSIFNDKVLIESHVRMGKSLEDSRLYLAGGCQEPVLHNEVNSRAFLYLNLPQLMGAMLFPKRWTLWEREGIKPLSLRTAGSFEQFYERFMFNFARVISAFAARYQGFEQLWQRVNPCPMFSATMVDCIDSHLDVSQGGARYNSSSFSLIGIGTLIDSLYAVRQVVYDEKKLSMDELAEVLDRNFEGHEPLRQYLINRVPKYGKDDPGMMALSGRVFGDLSRHASNMPNGRGGYFEASLFAFYFYETLKGQTVATPDGRMAGTRFSRGCNPSESTESIDAATLLNSVKAVDYADYPGCAVLYMNLPVTYGKASANEMRYIMDGFLRVGGNVMDFNVVNTELLRKAQQEPDRYRNLVVRVCGYSAPFLVLSKELQDEIIARNNR